MSLADAWTVDELRHQVGASEHMLAVTLREYEENPSTTRLRAVNEAALWQVWFHDLLIDRLQAEHIRQERRAA